MENEILDGKFKVKTPVFEGPFGLLLRLIEERKLFINDVSLASVTEDYISYVNSIEDMPRDEIASFISIASTLILIKSKSLLPGLTLLEEEEKDIKNLEDRLKLYKLYSELAIYVKNNFGKNIIFPALESKKSVLVFLPDERITKENMMLLAQELINKIPKKVFLPKVEVKKVVSIEEMIDRLTERIHKSLNMNFKEFAGVGITKEEKVTVIVSFLAMLELVRVGVVHVIQENNFEDIIINKREEITEEVISVIEE
ncbi:MAG: segregation/condensation protein A [Patescibacteria group bacterium]